MTEAETEFQPVRDKNPTEHYLKAESGLAQDQRQTFYALVADYRFATTAVHGRGVVSPRVIAELVKLGWTRS